MISENVYILYRKTKGWLGSILFILFRIFSINNKRICITTFEGKGGFNCNPKYIVKELHRRSDRYEFVWLVDDITKAFPEYIKKKKIPYGTGHFIFQRLKFGLIITANLLKFASVKGNAISIPGMEMSVSRP